MHIRSDLTLSSYTENDHDLSKLSPASGGCKKLMHRREVCVDIGEEMSIYKLSISLESGIRYQ